MAANSGTYVYCLVKSERRPSLARMPRGLPGSGPPRAVEGPAGTWLIVSGVPLDRYGAGVINRHLKNLEWVSRRALAHEAVVEFFARSHDVVPMKLFTIFRGEDRALSHVGNLSALPGVFRRIAGCSEWSVRVSWSPAAAAPASAAGRPRRAESGAAFLHRKKTRRDEVRKAAADARRSVEEVFRRLDAIAKDAVRKEGDVPGSSLVLDAAFLVSRKKHKAFERQVARLAASSAEAGCELVLSGPWPPYHFASGT